MTTVSTGRMGSKYIKSGGSLEEVCNWPCALSCVFPCVTVFPAYHRTLLSLNLVAGLQEETLSFGSADIVDVNNPLTSFAPPHASALTAHLLSCPEVREWQRLNLGRGEREKLNSILGYFFFLL